MPEQTVSLLALLTDRVTPGLQKIRSGILGLGDARTSRTVGFIANRILGIGAAAAIIGRSIEAARRSGLDPQTFQKLDAATDRFNTNLGKMGILFARIKTGALQAHDALASFVETTSQAGNDRRFLERFNQLLNLRGRESVLRRQIELGEPIGDAGIRGEKQELKRQTEEILKQLDINERDLKVAREKHAVRKEMLEFTENELKLMAQEGAEQFEIIGQQKEREARALEEEKAIKRVIDLEEQRVALLTRRDDLLQAVLEKIRKENEIKERKAKDERAQEEGLRRLIQLQEDAAREEAKLAEDRRRAFTFEGGVGTALDEATERAQRLGDVGHDAAGRIIEGFAEVGPVILDALTTGENAGKALLRLLGTIVQDLAVLFLRLAALRLVGGATVGFGGLAGSFLAGNRGGRVRRFNAGGPVDGSGPNMDSIPALLAPNEHVIQSPSVDFYGGHGVMELINRRLLPRGFFDGVRPAASITDVSRRRFATGGAVGGSASVGADVSAPGRAFVLPDEQSVYRMLAAGRAGFLRFYRENAHVLATTNERRPGRRAP